MYEPDQCERAVVAYLNGGLGHSDARPIIEALRRAKARGDRVAFMGALSAMREYARDKDQWLAHVRMVMLTPDLKYPFIYDELFVRRQMSWKEVYEHACNLCDQAGLDPPAPSERTLSNKYYNWRDRQKEQKNDG